MPYSNRQTGVIYIAIVISWAAIAVESEAAWVNFQANAQHTSYVQGFYEAADTSLLWSKEFDDGLVLRLTTAAIAQQRVFITVSAIHYSTISGTLYAYDVATGDESWHTVIAPEQDNESAPAYDNGYVYLGTGASVNQYDAATGQLTWSTPRSSQDGDFGNPTVFGGSIYTDAGYFGGFESYDLATGDRNWFNNMPQQHGWSPAVKGEEVFIYMGKGSSSPGPNIGRLYVFDRHTGVLNYEILDTDSNSLSGTQLHPVLGNHNDAFILNNSSGQQRLVKFDLLNQEVEWAIRDTFQGQLALAEGEIYGIRNGMLTAMDEFSGSTLWTWSPPSLHNLGYMAVTDSHIFVGASRGIHAINRQTHLADWSYNLPSTLGAYKVALSEGILVVSDLENIYAFQLTPSAVIAPSPVVPEPSSLTLSLLALCCVQLTRKFRRS